MARWDAAKVLPEPASSKYRRLAGVAQDRQAAYRRAADEVEEARQRATKARIDYTLAQRSPLTTVEGIARAKAPIADHDVEIAQLIQERDERGARSQGITGLVGRLDNFIGDLPSAAKVTLFSGPLPARKKGEPLADVITRCRHEIERLRERITEIVNSPRPLKEALARATAEIDALAERGKPEVDGLIDGASIAWATRPLELLARTPDGMPVVAHGSNFDALATFAWLLKPALIEAVTTAVRQAGGDDADAVPLAARPKMIAALRTSMLELERVEERAIEEIESTGAAFERRADADPRAVLNLSGNLPAPREDI